MRYVILLVIGVCIGYQFGFHDAQQNDKTIVTRIVERLGGVTRDHMKNDVDSQMNQLERH